MARGMIPTDLFRIQWVSDARLSPDGRLVAFTVTRLNEEADHYCTAIWAVPTDGTTSPRRFTGGTGKDSAPRWAPDGDRLALVSARHRDRDHDRAEDIFVVETAGGEPVRLTPGGGVCALPVWSPDGHAIAYLGYADAEDAARHSSRCFRQAQSTLAGLPCVRAGVVHLR